MIWPLKVLLRWRKNPPRRPSRLAAGLITALVGCLVVAAALPALIPKAWLGRQLSGLLEQRLARPVRIESVRLGWIRGLVVEGLEVDRHPDFGQGLLLRMTRARCSLAPWRWVRQVLGQLQLDQPELWVVLDRQGRLNLGTLPPLDGSLRIDSWLISSAALHLVDQQRSRQLDLQLGVLKWGLDRATGRARWQIDGRLVEAVREVSIDEATVAAEGQLLSEGSLTLPTLSKRASLGGQGRFEWSDLDLSTVPVHLFPSAGLERLGGRSDGEVDLEVGSDLRLRWRLTSRLRKLTAWHDARAQPRRLESLDLTSTGHFNPSADLLTIEQIRCVLPGFELRGDSTDHRPALLLGWRSDEPIRVNLAGEVEDFSKLLGQVPEMERLLSGTRLAGGCRFKFRWVKSLAVDEVAVRLWSDRLSVVRAGVVEVAPGCPAELRVVGSYERDSRRLSLEQMRVVLGASRGSVTADVSIPAPGADLAEWLACLGSQAALEAEITTTDLAELLASWPVLAGPWWRGPAEGPASVSVSLLPSAGGRARCELVLPASSVCRIGRILRKTAGKELRLAAWAHLAGLSEGLVDQLGAAFSYGSGLASLGSGWQVRYSMRMSDPERLDIDAAVGGQLELRDVEQLLAAVPAAGDWLAGGGGRLGGGCNINVGLNLRGAIEGGRPVLELWRLRAEVAGDGLEMTLKRPLLVRKRAGEPLVVDVDYLYDRLASGMVHQGGVRWRVSGMAGRLAAGFGQQREVVQLKLGISEVSAALAHVPGLAERVRANELVGGFDLTVRSQGGAAGQQLSVVLEGRKLGFVLATDPLVGKPAGVELKLEGRLRSTPAGAGRAELVIDELMGQVAGCRLRFWEGRVVVDRGGEDLLAGRLGRVELRGSVDLVVDESLRRLSPVVDELIDRYGLAGRVAAEVGVDAGLGKYRLTGELDATGLSMAGGGGLVKPCDEALRASFDVTAEPVGSEELVVAIKRAAIEAGPNRAEGGGRVWVDHSGRWSETRVDRAEGSVSMDFCDLERLGWMWPGMTLEGLGGGVSGEGSFELRDGRVGFGQSRMALDGVGLEVGGRAVELSGVVQWSDEVMASEGLSVVAGNLSVVLAGRVDDWRGQPGGEVMLASERMDFDELGALAAALGGASDARDDGEGVQARELVRALGGCNLTGRAHIGRAKATDRRSGAVYLIDELNGDFAIGAGRLAVPFSCVVSGGVVEGVFSSELLADEPYYDLKYKAERVQPRPEIAPLVERFFPGMTVSGPMSIEEESHQRLLVRTGPGNYPTGKGMMLIEGGSIVGRAAPKAVTRIFPGLNLVKYDFRRMRNWLDKDASGRTRHRMIFLGKPYNLFIDGYSTADGWIEYELGIDLLARFESPYWAEKGQGRIPVFTKTGRVGPGGTLLDERVRYVTAAAIMKHIVKDNLVTATYHATVGRLRAKGN